MATLNIYFDVVTSSGSSLLDFGKRATSPYTLTYAGGQIHKAENVSLATATTLEILSLGTSAGDDLPDADFFAFIADKLIYLEFQGASAANNSVVSVLANTPFCLSSDSIKTYGASGSIATAAVDFKKVYARNESGTTALLSWCAVT